MDDPTIALTQLRYDSANENSTQDIRIIFGWFYGANAAKVICEVSRLPVSPVVNIVHRVYTVCIFPNFLAEQISG